MLEKRLKEESLMLAQTKRNTKDFKMEMQNDLQKLNEILNKPKGNTHIRL
jgi:hypothetical protein